MNQESNLLTRIAQKDENAFKIVYEDYHLKIYTYALKYLKSDIEAQEVMQEVFLKLWLRDSNALSINNLEHYLRMLTRNRSLDVLRRKVLENNADLNKAINWKEEHNDTEESILLNDTQKVLDQAINLLPPQQKLVYKLCRDEGLSYDQVAAQLNLSPATVHTHMKLALKFLRTYVQQHTDILALLVIFKLF
ncbi:RNA polymerase sigma-70 factor [Pedobacter sp. MC2016-14]|uniref:RNA polymerase sigma factor n=1 Tax=Pedobacter sp. MC2016-14 TaxID=2897327 RepID=UPI001E5A80D8|nr:RNA polymerase sigma-70 factor [Pedobacter sp. MC2016-14]MCD0488101.1 RNA polymerase sigma-70 factor [Pedobacter sp. MC2016-14]